MWSISFANIFLGVLLEISALNFFLISLYLFWINFLAMLASSRLLLWCKGVSWMWISFVVTALEYLEYWTEKEDTFEAWLPKNVFIRGCKNQTEPLNMTQNVFKTDFMNFNGSLMGLRREKWIFEGLWHVWTGKDH